MIYPKAVRQNFYFFIILISNFLLSNNLNACALEADAGPDLKVCSYEYILPVSGDWETLCAENGGSVSFSLNEFGEEIISVSKCGQYTIILNIDDGICIDSDTAIITFEIPDITYDTLKLSIDLELDIECLVPPMDCGNVLSMAGADSPTLNWNLCATEICDRRIYSTQLEDHIDSCMYEEINILIDTIYTSDQACSNTLITGDNFIDVVEGLFEATDLECDLKAKCFAIELEFEVQIDTHYLYIPILEGGLWHYYSDQNILLPLMDSTLITIKGISYLFVIEPGSEYYGPDDLVFSLYAIGPNGTYIPPTVAVELQIEYVLEYSYDLVEYITKTLVLQDGAGEDLLCPSKIIVRSSEAIPNAPTNPCGPITLNFFPKPADDYFHFTVYCYSYGEQIEVCPGQYEAFSSQGEYIFNCVNDNGCEYTTFVSVDEDLNIPDIEVVSYSCDPGNLTYSVEIYIGSYGGFVSLEIEGNDEYYYGSGIHTINGIPNCQELFGIATNLDNGCSQYISIYHCCECEDTQATFNEVICEGNSFEFLGYSFDQTGSYEFIRRNNAGCDSLIILDLVVFPILNHVEQESICEGEIYNFFGQNLNVAGEYLHSDTNGFDCLETYTLILEIYEVENEQIEMSICEGDTYDFYGEEISNSGFYTVDQIDENGCNYQMELILEINSLISHEENVILCDGETIEFNGAQLQSTGTYQYVETNAIGCEETYTLNLEYYPENDRLLEISICEEETYDFYGIQIEESGTYISEQIDDNDCPYLIELHLDVNPINDQVQYTSLCKGESIEFFGEIIDATGEYYHIDFNAYGCEEEYILNLEIFEVEDLKIEASMCEGEAYDFYGEQIWEGGNYTSIQTDQNDCSYVVELQLTISEKILHEETVSICEGEEIEFFGEFLSVSGIYYHIGISDFGCEEEYRLFLEINEAEDQFIESSICEGDSYDFYGMQISESGNYITELTNENACTYKVELQLTINPVISEEEFVKLCEGESVTFHGEVYNTSGEYYHSETNAFGCIEETILYLEVNEIEDLQIEETICEGQIYDFYGEQIESSGSYTTEQTDINGCNYTVTLNLEVSESILHTEDVSLCQGELIEFQGSILSEAGVYTLVEINDMGCEEEYILNLEILEVANLVLEESICEGTVYNFYGDQLSEPGTYISEQVDENGCKFIIQLELELMQVLEHEELISLCDGETLDFYGNILSESGEYIHTETNSFGCEEIYKLILDIYEVEDLILEATICDDTVYDFYGDQLSEPGNYFTNQIDSNGCTYKIDLILEVNPVTKEGEYISLCAGETMDFYGQLLSEAGEYIHVGTSALGCAEIFTLYLEYFVVENLFFEETICEGEIYNFYGEEVSESGIFTSIQEDVNGCEFIAELKLTVSPILEYYEAATICKGESIVYQGQTFDTAGTYTITNYDNVPCGEFYTFDLTEIEIYEEYKSITLCKGESLPLSNITIDEAGIYLDTLRSLLGCDSIVHLDVSIDSVDFELLTSPTCYNVENGMIQVNSIQGGDGPYFFSVNNGSHIESEFFDNLSAGDYLIKILDENGCENSKQITVEEIPELKINLKEKYHLTCEEPELNLDVILNQEAKIEWSTGHNGNNISLYEAGDYSVILSNQCEVKEMKFSIEVETGPDVDLIYIPNAFSPNGDLINDVFKVYYATVPIEFQLKVFDRWGNKMFHTNDPADGWSGFYKNTKMDPGVFVYEIKAVINSCFGHPKKVYKKGDVSLVK